MDAFTSPSGALKRHNQLTERVKSERKITHEVLQDILVMEAHKDFAELGYPSMYEYLVKAQRYSEGSAQRRLLAARLLKEIPEIQPKIQEGGLNLTQLVKLSIAVKQEQKATGQKVSSLEKKELLKKIENKNGLETEKLLTQVLHYTPKVQEKVMPQDQDYFLTLKLTPAQYEKLKKVQGFLSHARPDGNFAEIIEALCDKAIQAKEGATKKEVKKASSSESLKPAPQMSNTTAAVAVRAESARLPKKRVFIPTATQRHIFHKAKNCCEYVSSATGHRCNSRYQLQIDHILPLAKGGGNNPESLRVLCRTHNLAEARRLGLTVTKRP